MQKVFGYVNVQLLDQNYHAGVKRAKRYILAFTELSHGLLKHYSESSMDFTSLSQKCCEIFDKTSEEEIYIRNAIFDESEYQKK